MSDYDTIVEQEEAGTILVGIDRAFARRFYTDVSLATIGEKTGETPYLEKLVVFGAFIGKHITLLGAVVLAVLVLGWWSAVVIPIGILIWVLFSSTSSLGGSRMLGITFILAGTLTGIILSAPARRPV